MTYNKQEPHKMGYFRELLASNQDIDDGLRSFLRLCREMVVMPNAKNKIQGKITRRIGQKTCKKSTQQKLFAIGL